MAKLPGGELANRPLHFIWIVDCSGSMAIEGKIQQLNNAIKEALPAMRKVAEENPHAEVFIRAIRFSTGAQWQVSTPTRVASFQWEDMSAGGLTHMGKALAMVAEQLRVPPMSDRALPPVLVLVSDGYPNDDFRAGLEMLMSEPWGKKAVRIAIAIGKDAAKPDARNCLQDFIHNPELEPLQANNADTLVKYIQWASTAVLQAASAPPSQPKSSQPQQPGAANVPIPKPPDATAGPATAADVW